MNDKLVEHFMQSRFDKKWLDDMSKQGLNQENIFAVLENSLPEWSVDVSVLDHGSDIIATTLYMPGKIITYLDKDEKSGLINIIRDLTQKVNLDSNNVSQTEQPSVTPQSASKKSTADVLADLQAMNDKVAKNASEKQETPSQPTQPTQPIPSLLDQMMNDSITNQKNVAGDTPTEVPFESKEAQDFEKEFWNGVKASEQKKQEEQPKFIPSPETINPGNLIMKNQWTPEQGQKIKAWMAEMGVTQQDQLSSWLLKYCNLDYEHFNPQYVDNFIEWTKELREKQTY